MSDKNQTLLVHALCVLVIAVCFLLAFLTPLRSQPAIGATLVGAAGWLWGKLTGKPVDPILNTIIANMEPKRVEQIMSQHPPAAPPAAPPAQGAS
jgi:uncharacterized membrane protein YjjB (DUF3815 family)